MPPSTVASVTLRFSRSLLAYWAGAPSVDVTATTLAEAVGRLESTAPGMAARILDDRGRLRRHVAVFVNGDMVYERDPAAVALSSGDQVHIVPSVSGG